MTYCVAVRLDTGMIFASDSRTNAGVDHVATFTKMRVYEKKDDRVIVVLSSGNLAITQGVINILDRQARAEPEEDVETIWTATSMYDAAAQVGDALREMARRDGPLRRTKRQAVIFIPRKAVTGTRQPIQCLVAHPLVLRHGRLYAKQALQDGELS